MSKVVPLIQRASARRPTRFDRAELGQLLGLYGRKVAAGVWRDYALDFTPDMAVFSIFRSSFERPLYAVVKRQPAPKRGAYQLFEGARPIAQAPDLATLLATLA